MKTFFEDSRIGKLPIDSAVFSNCERINDAVFRNSGFCDGLVNSLSPNLSTYHELFNRAAQLYSDQPCLSSRHYDYQTKTSSQQYSSISYKQVNERRTAIGSGILAALEKKLPDMVAAHLDSYRSYEDGKMSPIISIFSANRAEWTLCDISCHGYSLTNTALYDNLGDAVTVHILQQTLSPFVFCSGNKVDKLLQITKTNHLAVQCIVSFDPVTSQQRLVADQLSVDLYTLDELEMLGKARGFAFCPPSPKTYFTISFTSGTTGAAPKGVQLTHSNAVAAISFLMAETDLVPRGKTFVFLPLTHIYERQTSSFAIMSGYELGYPHLHLENSVPDAFHSLVEDLRLFKPHYFSSVPRFLTKLESYVREFVSKQEDSSHLEDLITKRAKEQCSADMMTGAGEVYKPLDKIRTLVGFDHMLWTQTASAPVNKMTLIYLKASLGIGLSQLYGLTETFGAMTRTLNHEAEPGSCGSPSPTVELRLEDRPDLEYRIRENKGELLIRGPQVFDGYFKNEEETTKAFKPGNWFASGDVAHVLNGKLYIVDRVKNIFKLAHGEYISPERVENIYLSKNPSLQQLFVYGNPNQFYLVGIAGVSLELVSQFLGRDFDSEADMLAEINRRENRERFLQHMNGNVASFLNGLEKLGNVYFEVNPLTVERDVVTPTMKLKRAIASRVFAEPIERLYAEGKLSIRSRI